jgi:hypothetical protein
MALVTAPQSSTPDLQYEYHTITLDSVGQSSANTFTCHLQTPLRNVVQARLVAAHIHSNASVEHCYVSIKELDTYFNDRAFKALDEQQSMSKVRHAFASIVSEATTHGGGNQLILFRDNYPIVTQYIDPVRSIDRFQVSIMDQDGNTIKNSTDTGDNFLVIRFVCMKRNL